MTLEKAVSFLKKLTPYNIQKGVRYLRHFGVKEFMIRLSDRIEPDEVPYGPWYEDHKKTDHELEAQRNTRWKNPILLSVLVPVYQTPEAFLEEMIRSVLAQTYPFWELILANGSPENEGIHAVLAKYEAADSRIHVISLAQNLGLAGNTNAALQAAAGEYVCFLDHDDLLAPNALFEIADYLKGNPEADMVYTDEDKINAEGTEHSQPHLKPDFNLDLLRSNNYMCHFLCVRRKLALEAGGLGQSYDGAQDYDFILRCSEATTKIGHIPMILYHWRLSNESTAWNPSSKLYAYEAGQRAIQDHLKRSGEAGAVQMKSDYGFYRVTYPVQQEELVSIIIPNKDEKETLEKCLDSIYSKSTYSNYEIIIVENNSEKDETFTYYREIESKKNLQVVVWKGKGFNYSALNNFGVQYAKGNYLVFLNNDIEVITPGWIEELLGTCQRKNVGAVGAKLYYPDNTVQHAGIVIGIGGIAGSMFVGTRRGHGGYLHKADLMQDMSAVTAACMMVRRDVFNEIGGFETKLAVAFNDVDLCLRIREHNYLVVYDPYVEMYHYESKTRGPETTQENVRRFQGEIEYMRTRWENLLRDGDPYYNPNLSLKKWNYSLKAD